MSALEDWSEVRYDSLDIEATHAAADAAIAELEAAHAKLAEEFEAMKMACWSLQDELAALKDVAEPIAKRCAAAEYELKTLKTRRCEGCIFADPYVLVSELPDHVHCDLLHSAWRKTDCCSRWQPRNEAT